jgi:hypothetical protein
MRRTVVSGFAATFQGVLTAGFLLAWLSVWPIWTLYAHHRTAHGG